MDSEPKYDDLDDYLNDGLEESIAAALKAGNGRLPYRKFRSPEELDAALEAKSHPAGGAASPAPTLLALCDR